MHCLKTKKEIKDGQQFQPNRPVEVEDQFKKKRKQQQRPVLLK